MPHGYINTAELQTSCPVFTQELQALHAAEPQRSVLLMTAVCANIVAWLEPQSADRTVYAIHCGVVWRSHGVSHHG